MIEQKTTTAFWQNENDEVLFKEDLFMCDVPPKNTYFTWLNIQYEVTGIIHNFDDRTSIIYVNPC